MQPRCTVPIGIPVENGDHSFMGKISQRKILQWKDIKYLMIDEVSMMDSKVMQRLNSQLSKIKSSDEKVGGVSIIFLSDFLQLPSVSHYDLYIDSPKWKLGHDLWRSQNAVVILCKQMRQAGDQHWADVLRRIRVHRPTDDDIQLLNSRIGAPIPDSADAPIVVRRHRVRHAINNCKLKEISQSTESEEHTSDLQSQ